MKGQREIAPSRRALTHTPGTDLSRHYAFFPFIIFVIPSSRSTSPVMFEGIRVFMCHSQEEREGESEREGDTADKCVEARVSVALLYGHTKSYVRSRPNQTLRHVIKALGHTCARHGSLLSTSRQKLPAPERGLPQHPIGRNKDGNRAGGRHFFNETSWIYAIGGRAIFALVATRDTDVRSAARHNSIVGRVVNVISRPARSFVHGYHVSSERERVPL
ncbi:hypothetical protein J6590_009740 [Homalodisca vitripennis]|nr:hypothetical protein J6590_009740 [Homalodisca vitripennis]